MIWLHHNFSVVTDHVRSINRPTDVLVVEIVYMHPSHSLCLVDRLLLLKNQLGEQLLHLLVAIIDAELLKTIVKGNLVNRQFNMHYYDS